MRAFYKTRLYVSGSDRRVQFKNAIAEFFNPHVLPHPKKTARPTPHNLVRFAAKLRHFHERALPEESLASNKKLRVCVLNPIREGGVTFSLFGVLLDHCNHFTHGCGNALFVKRITRSSVGFLTLNVSRAVSGEIHEII
jgi:hypothetical protein